MDRKWLYPGLAAGIVVAGAIGVTALLNPIRGKAQSAQNRARQQAAPTPVEVTRPQRRDLVRQTRLAGTVLPWEETHLYAKASGYLREIRVDKGDRVTRGQLLAVLDIPEMADDLAERRALEQGARQKSREPVAALATARAEEERSRRELDQARSDLEAARAAAEEPESLRPAAQAEIAAARAAVQEPLRDVETAGANLRAARTDLQAAEAELDRYRAEVRLRERTFERYRRLVDRDVVTPQEFDQVEAGYHAARAALDSARKKILSMQERAAAAQSAVEAAEAKRATAEARALTPVAQIQSIDARSKTARARVASAEKAVKMAEARVAIATSRLAESNEKIGSARADVATAAAGARKVQTLMQYRRLTAPYAGLVTERNVDPGQLVQAATSSQGRPLVVVCRVDRVRVSIPVPEPDVPHLKVGSPVTITFRELAARTWRGKIARYTSDLDPAARTMKAEIDLENPDGALRPGMYADVVIGLETHHDALVVPTSAVVVEKQKRSLWVVRGGAAQKVEVSVGVDNGVDAEILSGIGPAESVIVSGQSGLQSGQTIAPVAARRSPLQGPGSTAPPVRGPKPHY